MAKPSWLGGIIRRAVGAGSGLADKYSGARRFEDQFAGGAGGGGHRMGMIPFAEIDYDGIGLIRSGSRDDGEEQEQSGDEQDSFQNDSSFILGEFHLIRSVASMMVSFSSERLIDWWETLSKSMAFKSIFRRVELS